MNTRIETIGHSAFTKIEATGGCSPARYETLADPLELSEAEIRAGLDLGKLFDPLIGAARDNHGEIRAYVGELRGWMEDLEESVTPRPTGGQQCGTTPSLRSSLRHLITVAGRLRELIGWDSERRRWT